MRNLWFVASSQIERGIDNGLIKLEYWVRGLFTCLGDTAQVWIQANTKL